MLSFRALVAISRPLFWFNTAVPYAWGWLLSGRPLDLPTVLLVAYFTFPFNLLLHGVNDIYDYESDLRNARKNSAEGALIVHPGNFRQLVILIAAWNLPAIVALALLRSWGAWLAFAGLIALSVAYSAPPRFKSRPGLDSLANILYAGSFLVAVLANRVEPTPWAAVAAFALWAVASHAFTSIQDIPADGAAGIRTIAVALGATPTALLALALYALGAALVGLGGSLALALLFSGYVLLVAAYLLGGRSYDLAHRLYRVFFTANIAAGTLISLALIWQQRPVIPWPIAGTLMVVTCAVTTLALLWTVDSGRWTAGGERAEGGA
jgi:4-hydroxybenzoate polyprenyltransferase